MPRQEIITGLDIGSHTIRMVVGRKESPQEPLKIVGAVEAPAEGINKGIITSIEDAVSSITACLERAERMVGLPIAHAWVGISGTHIITQESRGIAVVAKTNGEIQEGDVERAIGAAQAVAIPPNYEILHVIPKNFIIDGQEGIKDPLGMSGVRLEVETQLVLGLSSQVQSLTKCIYRTSLDINDLVFSILAVSEAVLDNKQKDSGVVLIDLGGATTNIIVFEEGEVKHTAVLPIGSGHITNDIALGLRISMDAAEKIKLEHSTALAKSVSKRDDLNLADLNGVEEGIVSKRQIAEIVSARVEEIFETVDKELKKIERSGMLPAGAVLVGNGAKLPGLVELAKQVLRLPASLGQLKPVETVINRVQDIGFATALGLVLWGEQLQPWPGSGLSNIFSRFHSIDKVVDSIKKRLKSLIS